MKAVVYTKYGPPEVLGLKDVDRPAPKDDEVLIKVHAASVNSWDWDLLRGNYIFVRMEAPFRPKYKILGADVAGVVEGLGKNVTTFKIGDEVFGDISGSGWGAFAEYVCASHKVLALKSDRMTFEQAAAIPQAGVMALQGLRDIRQIKPGQKVLINGAGGSTGTFAIQIAKMYGAEVTAVDTNMKLEFMRSLGADHVIDYKKENFSENGQQYDLILDVMAHHPMSDYMRALSHEGICIMVGGSTTLLLKIMLRKSKYSKAGGKQMTILMHKPNPVDLQTMNELFESGKVVPIIDKIFPLSETPEAIQHLGEAKALGKVVISV